MGALSSMFKRHQPQLLAICPVEAVEALTEQDCGREVVPAEVTDWRGRTELLRAVEAGDEAAARRLVAAGACAGKADHRGITPLMAAAGRGAAWLCALLLDAGADVGARDSRGLTALHFGAVARACGEDGPVAVELLLQCSANPHSQDDRGRSALHCALQASNLEAAEVLVPAVGPLLLRDDTGRTELHWAAANGTAEMVRQLLARASGGGVDRDGAGMTPLARALEARNRATAGVLAETRTCEPNSAPDDFGRTVLHWAADAGYPEVVRHLLKRGFSPRVLDAGGRDALLWAAESGEREVVEALLEEGGYRDCVDERGQNALHVAATVGDAAIVALLLDAGADAARTDAEGRTPLMYALRFAHRDAASLLLKRGPARMRWRDRRRRTALHWAAVGGDVDLVRDLLVRGAPINAVDSLRKTPAALAVDYGHEGAAAELIGTDCFRVIHDREGRTPLHGAAAAGWTRVAMRLLELGAHPYDGGCDNQSPVALAMNAGHYSLAQEIAQYRWSSGQLCPFGS